ncbi:MAG: AAA family ATPase, partial [Rhizobacter sp.]|nr:AAA family ATPase [Rhizobacter sp.]
RGRQGRVGVHTGTVLLGGGVDAEATIRGHAVNVAARMEQTAPPGALRISDSTYRHVRGVFDVEAQPPLQVKGLQEPVVTYLVRRVKPRSFRVAARGIEGVETRMIGRNRELALLQAEFDRVIRPGAGLACISIVAEAGVGKSRLLYEFQNWAETRPQSYHLFQGRATPQLQRQPYGLLRDIVAWRLQIQDTDSMEVAKDKLERFIVPLLTRDEGPEAATSSAHLLGQMIGLDFSDSKHVAGIVEDARQLRARGFRTAALAFAGISEAGTAPVVLVLEDLHWADDASLDFLQYLVRASASVPMLIVSTSRPTLFERRDPMIGAAATRIELAPLDAATSDELARELLQRLPRIPSALRTLLVNRAEGNPFYMEESVKMLIDARALVPTREGWRVDAEKVLATEIPGTVTGVVQARLDLLPGDERQASQVCAVVGFNFWDQAIAFVEPGAERKLPLLARRELISPKKAVDGEPTPQDALEYVFGHHLLHQVTYETVIKSRRQKAHARAAEWFVTMTGARANDFIGIAAEHFEKAGEAQRACECFARAAEHAARTFANEMSLEFIERGLKLAGAGDHKVRWRLLASRERTLDLQGRRVEQRADVESLTELAELLDDELLRGEAAYRRADIAMRTGDYATSETEARRAVSIAMQTGADVLLLHAQTRLATALANQGRPLEGEQIAQLGRNRARELGLKRLEAFLVNALGICSELTGDTGRQLDYLLQGLALGREIDDRRVEAVLYANAGLIFLRLGGDAQASQHLEEALRRNRELGIREMEGHVLCSMAELLLRQGEGLRAHAAAEVALAIATEVRSRQNETSALSALGNADLLLGRWQEAAENFQRMEALAREIAFPAAILDALEGQTHLALVRGNTDEAASSLDHLLAYAEARDESAGGRGGRLAGSMEHRVRLTTYKVWARRADGRAAAALEDAYGALMSEADRILDEGWRESFLENIPEHREIASLWKQYSGQVSSTRRSS